MYMLCGRWTSSPQTADRPPSKACEQVKPLSLPLSLSLLLKLLLPCLGLASPHPHPYHTCPIPYLWLLSVSPPPSLATRSKPSKLSKSGAFLRFRAVRATHSDVVPGVAQTWASVFSWDQPHASKPHLFFPSLTLPYPICPRSYLRSYQ